MSIQGEYEPSPRQWVRDQVEQFEASGGTEATTLRDTGLAIVVITNLGAKTGKVRKTPLMRVEHDGKYAAVASQGGAPTHPLWYFNFLAHPHVELQDGPKRVDMVARELTGHERAQWWERAVAAFPPYAEYQTKTTRQIPVFVLEPVDEVARPGLGLAVPINATTRKIIAALMQYGRVRRAYLGVVSAPTPLPTSLHDRVGGKDGLRVAELVSGGPADRAGLRVGDILVTAADRPVTTAQDLQRLMFAEAIGKPLEIAVLRNGALVDVIAEPAELTAA